MTHHPHNHLEQWLADEVAVQKRLETGPGPGVARPEQIAGLLGFDVQDQTRVATAVSPIPGRRSARKRV